MNILSSWESIKNVWPGKAVADNGFHAPVHAGSTPACPGAIISRWKIPENTAWSTKIKHSGFLPAPESAGLRGWYRMQKIVALNFCAPELSIY